MQTDQKEGETAKADKAEEKKEAPVPAKKAKKYKSIDLPITITVQQLSKNEINLLYEKEVGHNYQTTVYLNIIYLS